jgi:hypothetical protein
MPGNSTMKRLLINLALIALILGSFTACATHSGSREYVPGKGWIYND